ncbi:hypothetical protein HY214_04915 [Candidatus Roizmanbacteria bacterium]|nr:hypothetical protein [Candidatus Roizmanbacteria bacterium]
MNLRSFVLTGATVATVALTPVTALAQSTVPARRGERAAAACEKIKEHLGKARVEKGNHVARWDKLTNRLSNLVNGLQKKGYDVTQLQTDLGTANTMKATVATDYSTLTNLLATMKGLSCSDPATKATLQSDAAQAKVDFQTMKSDMGKLRDFFQTTIKADLQAVKAQKSPTPTPTITQ